MEQKEILQKLSEVASAVHCATRAVREIEAYDIAREHLAEARSTIEALEKELNK